MSNHIGVQSAHAPVNQPPPDFHGTVLISVIMVPTQSKKSNLGLFQDQNRISRPSHQLHYWLISAHIPRHRLLKIAVFWFAIHSAKILKKKSSSMISKHQW